MEIKYAEVTLEEVKKEKEYLLKDVPGTFGEEIKLFFHSIGISVLCIVLAYCYFINCFPLSDSTLWRLLNEIWHITATDYAQHVFIVVLYLLIVFVIFLLNCQFLSKLYFNVFPLKTPCLERNKKNRILWEKMDDIEEKIKQQQCFKDFLSKDKKPVYILKEDRLVVAIENEGYFCEKEFAMNTLMLDKFDEQNTIDFSYIDDIWKGIQDDKRTD